MHDVFILVAAAVGMLFIQLRHVYVDRLRRRSQPSVQGC